MAREQRNEHGASWLKRQRGVRTLLPVSPPVDIPPGGERQPLRDAARQLVASLREGTVSETAYDTAIVARLVAAREPRRAAFPAATEWLRRHQHADGSWGGRIETGHDRLVSTLAALVRLAEVPEHWAEAATRDGVAYLWQHARDWQGGAHETVAFELLVPQLLATARQHELPLPYEIFEPVLALREEKLRKIPADYLYNTPTTLLHSLEFLGRELDAGRILQLRSRNGSYGCSPSATAHVLAYARDDVAERYLQRVMGAALNGGAPTIYPFEIFERGWVLYNLGLADTGVAGTGPHLRYLADTLTSAGLGMSREGLQADCDDTAMALIVLARAGYKVDLTLLRPFERDGWFSTFPFERNTSNTVNARVLEALKVGGGGLSLGSSPLVTKIVRFLGDQRIAGAYWQDKWHVSPYYATAQVALAARGIADALLDGTQAWLLDTQHPDGSWGRYGGTSEETAYALQTLHALGVDRHARAAANMARGANFLAARLDDTDYPELWIGKGLYTPYAIVRSAVISALLLCQRL
jgi:halimadienyl-diphosphate synthase